MSTLRWQTHDGTVEFFDEAAGVDAAGQDEASPEEAPQSAAAGQAPTSVVEQDASSGGAEGTLCAGTVAFWQMHHEYGFIRPDDPGQLDVWVSVAALEGFAESLPHLAKRERVLYEAVPSDHRASAEQEGRQKAIRVLPEQILQRGAVSEYSFMHGYGAIAGDDGTRYFLHRSNVLEGDYQAVRPGDEVFFRVGESDTRSGPDPVATAVKLGDPRPALHRFGQFPVDSGRWLGPLAKKAAPEEWGYRHEYATERAPYPILRHYLEATFERLDEEQRLGHPTILDGTDESGRPYAIFHTGLVDSLRRPVYALFEEQQSSNDLRRWRLREFLTGDEGPMREVAELPAAADYLSDPVGLQITPGEVASMRVDTKHILGDNLSRFPAHLRSDAELARQVFEGELRELPDRIRRNYRLAVAQYYRGSIHLLLPLHLSGASQRADLALVVERTPAGVRRASTVLGNDHAYQQARVIARPDADWLAHAWLKADDAPPAKADDGSLG
jgi:cold shock CspA family protein